MNISTTCNKLRLLAYMLDYVSNITYSKLYPKMELQNIIERLHLNQKRGEELVKFIQNELPALKAAAVERNKIKMEQELRERNAELKRELEYYIAKVVELEIMNNIPQYSLPTEHVKLITNETGDVQKAASVETDTTDSTTQDKSSTKIEIQKSDKKATKKENKKEKEPKPVKEEKPAEDKPVNVGRLDLRIGRILSAKKHPDAESLYVEEIDVGENKPRTVVSGLVKYVSLEEMQNRLVVVLCNLKPAKMRGVLSEAMVMCASTPEKVEILVPPSDSLPGDRVICNDFLGDPDPVLPPKKKIFEQVAPDLKTNDSCIATYNGSPLEIEGKGVVKTPSLTNVQIK